MSKAEKIDTNEQFTKAMTEAGALYENYVTLARLAEIAALQEQPAPSLVRNWSYPLGLAIRTTGSHAVVE